MSLINCPECGKEISDKIKTCIHCGYPILNEDEAVAGGDSSNDSPQQVELTGVKVKSGTKKAVAIFAVILVAIAITLFAVKQINEYKARIEYEISYNAYVDNLELFRTTCLSGGSDAEKLCNLTYKVWKNAIYSDKDSETDPYVCPGGFFLDDFNTSLALLYLDDNTKETISQIEINQISAKNLLKELQTPPEGLEKQSEIAISMYDAYKELTNLAVNPTGNLTSFSEKMQNSTDAFLKHYEQLGDRMPERFPSN